MALAHYGINLEDVRAALASANANRPKGVVETDKLRYQVYTNDTGTVASGLRRVLVIAYRDGSAVRLSDVASVIDGVESTKNIGLFNGKNAVLVVIFRAPGANIIQTVDALKKRLPALQGRPAGQDIDLDVAQDRSTTIRASRWPMWRRNLASISVILVIGVVAFFLQSGRARPWWCPAWRSACPCWAPSGAMYMMGFSLDNLSLMALTVATGFVVDDAIVVLENTTRHVEKGMHRASRPR